VSTIGAESLSGNAPYAVTTATYLAAQCHEASRKTGREPPPGFDRRRLRPELGADYAASAAGTGCGACARRRQPIANAASEPSATTTAPIQTAAFMPFTNVSPLV
jgi:hypothetical protein